MSNAAEFRTSTLRLRRAANVLAALLMFGLATATAQAQLAIATYAQIGPNYIDFGQYATGAPYIPYPGYGTFEVKSAGGLFSLAGITAGESGSIQSIDDAVGFADTPFITFAGGGSNLFLYATDLAPGLTSGPLTLVGLPFGTALSFDILGNVSSSTTGALGDFRLACSAEIAGISPAELLANLAAGAPVNTPLSCSVTVAQTTEQATQTIINAVETLYSREVLNGGQDNSLVKELQQAIKLMNTGKNAGAIQNLDLFISEVNDLVNSGVLSSSQATPLISAAGSVIARLS